MTWWQWVLMWLALAVSAAAYLGWRVWRLWAPLQQLGQEVVVAQDRLSQVEARIVELDQQLHCVDDLAVLQDPAELRRRRADLKARHRADRAARRKSHRPDWAHHVEW